MPKILAIDDNNDNLISLKAIIADEFPGSVVYTALNGHKGIELAIANNPDVILLDIIMPGMDGFEVCRNLKLDERVHDIPVVFLTALKGDRENRIKALEVGAEGFLSKPIDETELTAQIRAMVKIKAASEQKRGEKERLEMLVNERTRELVQSQAQLKSIFENLQDAYFQTDISGLLTVVSPSSVKIYGYQSPDELIGQPADNLYFDINDRIALVSVLRSAGSIKDHVCRGKKKDGSAFWVSMNAQVIKSSDGQILGTEGVIRDISERKKAEDVLKESEERFRHISSSISDISYSCVNDPEANSTINWLYGATEKITGYTIDELFAMKCWGKLVTDEDFPIFKSHILGVLPGKSETCQLRLKRKDGNLVWIQATAECVKGPEGTDFSILYGGIVDITKRKQAEELLRESEEKYRIMVELLPDAVIIHESGKFVFANAAALKTVGADSFEQLIERPLMDYVHNDYKTISLNKIKEIYSTGRPSKFSEEKFLTLKDEIIDVEVLGLPVIYMGKPAIQTIIRDITERKKAEETLQKNEERAQKQRTAIARLLLDESIVATEISVAVNRITEVIANTIDVERASIWMFSEQENELKCLSLYEAGKAKHSQGIVLDTKNYPNYFKAIHTENLIDADDAQADHRTNEFTEGYLKQQNITSMLDAKVQLEGRILGIVCLEHIGEVRKWKSDEKAFVNNVATIVSQVFTDKKRKHAEEKLAVSEERFRNIFNISPDSVAISEIETGKYVEVNSSFEKLSGFNKEEIIGKTSYELGLWIDNRQREIYIGIIKSEGEINNLEITFRKKDGSLVYTLTSSRIIETSGKLLILNVIKDITERKLAQEAIREREEKFRSIFENVQDVYYESLLDGTILEISPSIEILSKGQVCREDIIGRSLPDFYAYPEERTNVLSSMQKHGSVTDYELSIKNIDGSIIPCTISAKLVFDVQGHPEKIIGSLRDITQRKHDEEKIRKSEAQFREFFEKAADAIFIAEIESGIIVDVNQAATRLMNRPYDQLVGMHQTELHPSDMKDYSKETFIGQRDKFKGKLVSHAIEHSVVRADGQEVPVEILASEVDYQGKRCMMGTFRDITERKRASEALKNSLSLTEATLESIHNGILVVDLEGRIIKTSSRFAEMWQIPESKIVSGDDKILRKSILDLLADPDEFVSRVNELYAKPEAESTDQIYFKDGRIFERVSKPMSMDGKPKGRVWSFLDITDRKIAEDKLNENVARLELAMSTANMSWWEMDLVTGQVVFERRKAEMLGYSPEIFKNYTDFMELVHPQDYEHTMDAMRSHLNGSLDKYEVEYRIKTISGEYKWFYDIGSVTKRDPDGSPHIVSGIVLDISERKRAEEELQKSHNMLEKLAAQVPGVIYQYRLYPDGRSAFPFSSPGMFDIYEVTPDEVREDASPVFTRIHPDDYDYIVETIMESARNQTNYQSEFRVILPKQGLRWRMSNAKPELLEDGSTLWHGIITDITDRKKSEEALSEREQLFKGLFNASPDAIVLIDPHHPTKSWPIMDCNEASCRMNGYTREEMIGQSIDILNLIAEKPEDRAAYFNELTQKGIIHMETVHRHKDGHILPIEVSTSIVVIGGKEMILGIDRDITERKLAEKALKESEDRYRQFISQVSEGVYRFECDQPMDIGLPLEEQVDFIYDHMFIAECNDAFMKIYGIKDRSEMIGKGHLYFHGGRYHSVNREALIAFIKNGYHIENTMTEEANQLGQIIYISHNSLGIIENNQLVRMWGTQIDITQKIHADRVQQVLFTISNATLTSNDLTELIEIISNELGNLLDSTNFFIAFYDESTKMLSTLYEKGDQDNISNWPAEKSLTGYIIKHQKSILATESDILNLCETGEIEIVGTPSKIWMGVPLAVNKKVIGAIVVQSYDNPKAFSEKDKMMLEFVSHQVSISIERKKAEQDLKLMGKAFNQSPVTIVITDPKGGIEYVNPKFTETTGYTQDEVKGRNPRVLKSGNQSIEYYKNLWKTITSGNDWVGEFKNKRKNGETYWESALISPITNENGKIDFFLAIKEDITEKKKMIDDLILARNKAEEGDRLKSAFLANMSHEIRTPLNSIIGFSELMADPDFDADQQTEFAKIIINSGNSLLSIISDIMDFSKIEAGQVVVHKIPFVVQNLISTIHKEYKKSAQTKGIEFRIDPLNPQEEIWITTDENRLKQVLINLVGNAIKFTKEGFVELGIKAIGDFIQFRVTDTGIGIPETYHYEIFERFRQVESSNSRKYGGNGLGLAISKSLVEMMGGEIWVESVHGKGSTFYFTIPK